MELNRCMVCGAVGHAFFGLVVLPAPAIGTTSSMSSCSQLYVNNKRNLFNWLTPSSSSRMMLYSRRTLSVHPGTLSSISGSRQAQSRERPSTSSIWLVAGNIHESLGIHVLSPNQLRCCIHFLTEVFPGTINTQQYCTDLGVHVAGLG
jgi:hypothetical protein